MGKTSIEWTDYSWPIVNGCRRVSAGCENCYAERLIATRLSQQPKYKGLAVYKQRPSKVRMTEFKNGSVRLSKVESGGRPQWTGETRLWAPHLDMPLRLKKPSRIFVADMGDLFYEEVPDELIATVFGVMAACPQHTFQVLTKRPERAWRWFDSIAAGRDPQAIGAALQVAAGGAGWPDDSDPEEPTELGPLERCLEDVADIEQWPLPNVHLGVSVEDQATADERIPLLLQTPAAMRFVSYEPALGTVDFTRVQWPGKHEVDVLRGGAWDFGGFPGFTNHSDMETIDWVIVGGESGPGARPFDIAWARSVVRQCREAGVPAFVKQLGSRPCVDLEPTGDFRTNPETGKREFKLVATALKLTDRKGGNMTEWPEDLRVREFPAAPAAAAE